MYFEALKLCEMFGRERVEKIHGSAKNNQDFLRKLKANVRKRKGEGRFSDKKPEEG